MSVLADAPPTYSQAIQEGAGQQQQYYQTPHTGAYQGSKWNFSSCLDSRVTQIAVSLLLVAGAATAAYFLLSNGFGRLDVAVTSMEVFVGATLAAMGLVYALVAVGNTYLAATSACCAKSSEGRKAFIAAQVGLSVAAPLAAVPAVLYFGFCSAISRR